MITGRSGAIRCGRDGAEGKVVSQDLLLDSVGVGDRVLFDPEERGEVELQGATYILLRERDLHAVGTVEPGEQGTGLYL